MKSAGYGSVVKHCFEEQDEVTDFVMTVESKITSFKAALEKDRSEDSILKDCSSSSRISNVNYLYSNFCRFCNRFVRTKIWTVQIVIR